MTRNEKPDVGVALDNVGAGNLVRISSQVVMMSSQISANQDSVCKSSLLKN